MFLPAPDESCWVGFLRLALRVPGSRSLKEKRKPIAQIRDRLRSRKNLSVAEVGHLEDHSRSILAIVLVANDQRFIRSTLDQIIHDVGSWRGALIEDTSITVQRPGDVNLQSQYDDWNKD